MLSPTGWALVALIIVFEAGFVGGLNPAGAERGASFEATHQRWPDRAKASDRLCEPRCGGERCPDENCVTLTKLSAALMKLPRAA